MTVESGSFHPGSRPPRPRRISESSARLVQSITPFRMDSDRCRPPADVHLVLVPEPDGRPHIQPALESTHERQRRTVDGVALTGLSQRVPDEFFVGVLVRRIRVPTERFPGLRVRQPVVFGIPRLARQLRHVGRIENRPGHREPRLGRQSPATKAETGLDLIRALRVQVDLEGQRVERPAGRRQMFGCGQFEQARRIAGPDSGAGRQHELGQLRLLADAGGRRQVPRIQPGAGQVDGRRRLRGQHLSRLAHGRRPMAIRLGLRGLVQQQPHGVEWIELLRCSRKRGRHRGVLAGEAHQGRWTETGTCEPTPRCPDGVCRSEIAASQSFDDSRPVREAAHPEH